MAIITALEARLRCEHNTKHAADAQALSIEKYLRQQGHNSELPLPSGFRTWRKTTTRSI